jgi:acetylornithine aminotransferase
MEKSFHGRTMGALSATGNAIIHKDMPPLLPGFSYVPLNDIQALTAMIEKTPETVAVLIEPIQGEGGIRIAEDAYLKAVRALCDQKKIWLIVDEIQTGLGRTGKLFAHEHAGIKPDIMTLAKALGNGYPIGACLAGGEAAHMIQEGHHGTTFGGSPLACKIGSTVLQCLLEENLIPHAAAVGQHLQHRLKTLLKDVDSVVEVRGRGLMIGIEMKQVCTTLRPAGLKAGLVYSVTSKNVVRLVPPLCFTYTQADQLAEGVASVIRETKLS